MDDKEESGPEPRESRKRKAKPQKLNSLSPPLSKCLRGESPSSSTRNSNSDCDSRTPRGPSRSRRKIKRPDRYVNSHFDNQSDGLEESNISDDVVPSHSSNLVGLDLTLSDKVPKGKCRTKNDVNDHGDSDPESAFPTILQVNSYSKLIGSKVVNELNGSAGDGRWAQRGGGENETGDSSLTVEGDPQYHVGCGSVGLTEESLPEDKHFLHQAIEQALGSSRQPDSVVRRRRGRPSKTNQSTRSATPESIKQSEEETAPDERCHRSGRTVSELSKRRGRRGRAIAKAIEPIELFPDVQDSDTPRTSDSHALSEPASDNSCDQSNQRVQQHYHTQAEDEPDTPDAFDVEQALDLPKTSVRGRPPRRGRARGRGRGRGGRGRGRSSAQSTGGGQVRGFQTVKCGVCLMECQTAALFKKHINTEHNGLARTFGCDQTFTPEEERAAYNQCVKSGSKLRCKIPGCTRPAFTTSPGYQYHRNICGKEERRMVACVLCGKVLIPESIKPHMKAFHPVTPPPEENGGEEEVLPKKRAAAERAQIKVAIIAQEIKSPDQIKREISDEDYFYDGTEDDGEKVSGENEEQSSDEKLYIEPERIHISKELYGEWRDELAANGFVLCKNKGCVKVMNTIKTISFHYRTCSASTHGGLFTCIICQFSCYSRNKILKHVDLHKNGVTGGNPSDMECLFKPSTSKHKPKGIKLSLVTSQLYQSIRIGEFDKRLFTPHVEMATLFYHNNCQTKLFTNWPSLKSHWCHLSKSEREAYLPITKESVQFKNSFAVEDGAGVNDVDWRTLKLFESCCTNVESKVATCFTGGPIWACAWCPTLNTTPCQQFIAVYCHKDMDSTFISSTSHQDPGLLQIWDVGMLENENGIFPRLALGIADHYGAIWGLAWCASGCWEDPSSFEEFDHLPRLGLLAAACADGCIRIYSIPHPSSLHFDQDDLPIYTSTPVATLLLACAPESLSNFQCTALSWHQGRGHQSIVAGYNNGLIAVFDLTTKSPLLRTQVTIRMEKLCPYITFQAHGSMITGLDFSHVHNGRFFASVSRDRCIKFWDLENVGVPYNMLRNKVFTGVKWPPHWCGCYAYGDHSYNIVSNSTCYLDCGYYGETSITLASHNSSIWDASSSYWLNCLVSCDVAGEVVIAVVGHLMKNSTFQSVTNHRRLPLYRIETVPKVPVDVTENLANDMSNQVKTKMVIDPPQTSEKTADESETFKKDINLENSSAANNTIRPGCYKEASDTFRINYQNASVWNFKSIPLPELQHIANSSNMKSSNIDEYPLASVNRVSWNPNLGSHLWIAAGEQSGMLRFTQVNSLDKLSVEDVRVALATGDIAGAFD